MTRRSEMNVASHDDDRAMDGGSLDGTTTTSDSDPFWDCRDFVNDRWKSPEGGPENLRSDEGHLQAALIAWGLVLLQGPRTRS